MIISKYIPMYGELTILHHRMPYTYVGVTPPIHRRIEVLVRKHGTQGTVFSILKPYMAHYVCNVCGTNPVVHPSDGCIQCFEDSEPIDICEVTGCTNEVITTIMYNDEPTPACDSCSAVAHWIARREDPTIPWRRCTVCTHAVTGGAAIHSRCEHINR